jgi:hypothetical protein
MKHWNLAVCLAAICAGSAIRADAQTQYTNDGAMTGIEEEARWYANRARYDPVKEKARLSLASAVPSGPIAPLAPNAKLITAAQHHSDDMATLNAWGHDTPSGSAYYPAGYTFDQRIVYEGYSYFRAGENISAGTWYTNGYFAHDSWFLSETGHRDNLLDASFREVGIGHHYDSSSTYDHYYTEDFGTQLGSSQHWFTGTIFWDSSGDSAYDYNEGVAGVDIYLRTPAGLHSWYDRSSASGSFAIPISSIPDGTNVEVILVNNSGSATNVSIPFDYDTLLRVALTNSESYSYGTFVQPAGVTNVGFRQVLPHQEWIAAASAATDGVRVTAGTLPGGRYALQWRANLVTGSWAGAVTSTAAATTTMFLDAGGAGRPAPAASTSRFYRVSLLKDL